jgi:hypothetical protein
MNSVTAKPLTRTPLRFGAFRTDAEYDHALDRLKAWTRESLSLASDDTVLVAEMACGRPECPPLETVVTYWIARAAGAERHVFKVFKPATEVLFEDLPPAWLKDALNATDSTDQVCC